MKLKPIAWLYALCGILDKVEPVSGDCKYKSYSAITDKGNLIEVTEEEFTTTIKYADGRREIIRK